MMKCRRRKDSIPSYIMVAGIADIARSFSSLACAYQSEMTTVWRIAFFIQDAARNEGSGSERNL
jgi:hypothetical protein